MRSIQEGWEGDELVELRREVGSRFKNADLATAARSPPLISSPCSFSQPLISQGEGGRGEIAIFLSLFLSPFQTAALIILEDLLMLR